MSAREPRICCLDLDTFFVSVERLLDPSLEEQPVIVGGRPGQRGVVTAASYEVRSFGVHSGMSLTKAAKLAPHAIFLPTRQSTYGTYARRVRELAARYAPRVQVASIDELFLDLHGCEGLYRKASDGSDDETIMRTMNELSDAVYEELGLPCSIGIATSVPVAKIGSALAKPRGVLLVPAGAEAAFLAPLPVGRYPGIGPVARNKLEALGIHTLGQLAQSPLDGLQKVFGRFARRAQRGAMGWGAGKLSPDRPAFREHDPQGGVQGSISNERTFRADVGDSAVVESMLGSLCERVCWRARRRGVKARTVTVKLRYADFHTLTRSRTIAPTDSELELFPVARSMCTDMRSRKLPVRLIGVALSKLGLYDTQLGLFDDPSHGRLHRAVDALRERFGYDAVRLAAAKASSPRGRTAKRPAAARA